MFKLFLKNFFLNLLSTLMVAFVCCAVMAGFCLLNIYFGAIGIIVGIVIAVLVWIALMSYSEAKRKLEEKK